MEQTFDEIKYFLCFWVVKQPMKAIAKFFRELGQWVKESIFKTYYIFLAFGERKALPDSLCQSFWIFILSPFYLILMYGVLWIVSNKKKHFGEQTTGSGVLLQEIMFILCYAIVGAFCFLSLMFYLGLKMGDLTKPIGFELTYLWISLIAAAILPNLLIGFGKLVVWVNKKLYVKIKW